MRVGSYTILLAHKKPKFTCSIQSRLRDSSHPNRFQAYCNVIDNCSEPTYYHGRLQLTNAAGKRIEIQKEVFARRTLMELVYRYTNEEGSVLDLTGMLGLLTACQESNRTYITAIDDNDRWDIFCKRVSVSYLLHRYANLFCAGGLSCTHIWTEV